MLSSCMPGLGRRTAINPQPSPVERRRLPSAALPFSNAATTSFCASSNSGSSAPHTAPRRSPPAQPSGRRTLRPAGSAPSSAQQAATEAQQGGPQAAAGGGGGSSSGGSGKALVDSDIVSPKREAQLTLEQYRQIYDRLIKIFQERPRDDWKRLIVFSKQWDQHQQGVYDRIKQLADQEADVDKKMGLRKLLRALQNVADEVARYNSVLFKLGSAADDEWEAIVAVYRGDFQKPFFEHMQCLMAAAKADQEKLDKLVMLNARLITLCANHDAVEAEPEKLEKAAELYRDLLTSINSVEDLDKKMAELSQSGRIDPAFLQISAKAYGAARDTNMTKDEAKWVAYKLYRHAKDHFDRQQPVEKRIIEYLLTINDPQERRNQLDAAVTPGPMRNTETHDYMYSTPDRLFLVLDNTVRAFIAMRNGAADKLGTPEAAVLPRKVRVMMDLRDEIIRRYL